MNPTAAGSDVTALVKECALECGFDLARIAGADEFAAEREIALARIREGLMDGLAWYTESRVCRGTRPRELLPEARSIICLASNYFTRDPDDAAEAPGATGKIARYARGRDYHRVMKRRMRDYVQVLTARLGHSVKARWYVDDGPMLDRAAAARAGLGWFGKNTNILTGGLGSWVFLGQVITDLALEPDAPLRKTCGSCVRCIDACPTGAIVAPYVIDNARCISYLTIEHRGPIPRELRPLMLNWVFGCDICQEVCPVNRKARPTAEPGFAAPGLSRADLVELLELTDAAFRERFRGTPILRARREGLQRNACVALGNLKDAATVPALAAALREGTPLVRSHAAWALGKIGGTAARSALRWAKAREEDPEVLAEIGQALEPARAGAAGPG